MQTAGSRYRALAESTALRTQQWTHAIAGRVNASVLRELTSKAKRPSFESGLDPDQMDQRINEWSNSLIDAAMRIGEQAAQQAFDGLFFSGLASELVKLSRSHRAGVARKNVRDQRGRVRASWKFKMVDQILRNRRFMKIMSESPDIPEGDAIINKAVSLMIIDFAHRSHDPNSVYYMDYETGTVIAQSKSDMRSAISRLKKQMAMKNSC